jgi:hypothetical protein
MQSARSALITQRERERERNRERGREREREEGKRRSGQERGEGTEIKRWRDRLHEGVSEGE